MKILISLIFFSFSLSLNAQIIDSIKEQVHFQTHKIKLKDLSQCEERLEFVRKVSIGGTITLGSMAAMMAADRAVSASLKGMQKATADLNEALTQAKAKNFSYDAITKLIERFNNEKMQLENNMRMYSFRSEAIYSLADKHLALSENELLFKKIKDTRNEYLQDYAKLKKSLFNNETKINPLSKNPLDEDDLKRIAKIIQGVDQNVMAKMLDRLAPLRDMQQKVVEGLSKKLRFNETLLKVAKISTPSPKLVGGVVAFLMAFFEPAPLGHAEMSDEFLKDMHLLNPDISTAEICKRTWVDQRTREKLEDILSWVISYHYHVLDKLEFQNTLHLRPKAQHPAARKTPQKPPPNSSKQ